MSELTLRNRQRFRRLDVPFFRQIAESLLCERLRTRPYEISVFFVDARAMARLNAQHLQHRGSTDVITFGYSDGTSEPLAGDIFICVREAVRQARSFNATWQAELVRYFVHGVLHLQGYDDLAPGPRRLMKRNENRLMKQVAMRFRLSRIARGPRRVWM